MTSNARHPSGTDTRCRSCASLGCWCQNNMPILSVEVHQYLTGLCPSPVIRRGARTRCRTGARTRCRNHRATAPNRAIPSLAADRAPPAGAGRGPAVGGGVAGQAGGPGDLLGQAAHMLAVVGGVGHDIDALPGQAGGDGGHLANCSRGTGPRFRHATVARSCRWAWRDRSRGHPTARRSRRCDGSEVGDVGGVGAAVAAGVGSLRHMAS
jgi:hypothetical protein